MNSQRFSLPRLSRWLDRVQPSESAVLGGAALIVGLMSGAGVWLFKQLIEVVHRLTFDGLGGALSTISPWLMALVPALGGIAAGLLLHFFVGEERHHGVAGIMESVALAGGRLRYRRMPAKAVAAASSGIAGNVRSTKSIFLPAFIGGRADGEAAGLPVSTPW